MGKRFLVARYPLWSGGEEESHRLRPYGLGCGKFSHRAVLKKKHGSRAGNRLIKRMVKKAARFVSRQTLREEGSDG